LRVLSWDIVGECLSAGIWWLTLWRGVLVMRRSG
jgi:hypothetical protein